MYLPTVFLDPILVASTSQTICIINNCHSSNVIAKQAFADSSLVVFKNIYENNIRMTASYNMSPRAPHKLQLNNLISFKDMTCHRKLYSTEIVLTIKKGLGLYMRPYSNAPPSLLSNAKKGEELWDFIWGVYSIVSIIHIYVFISI